VADTPLEEDDNQVADTPDGLVVVSPVEDYSLVVGSLEANFLTPEARRLVWDLGGDSDSAPELF
jgi:hypothetical protein